jgi:tetratricopeptide (TPR) repeat protein
MFTALIVAATLGVFRDEAVPAQPKPDLAAYNEATARLGKSADAHVRLALWCEAHGMTAERLKHLSLAVLYDPTNALARGLMGLVAYRGKWERPDQVSREVQDDPGRKALIQEYLQRRAQLRERADDHWKLAVWCEQNGLKEQADAHLHQVLRLDPKRESAWKHLGFKRIGGRWIKPEEATAAKVAAQQQKKANDRWKPILERLRASLQGKDGSRRAEAEKALSQINDRRAVPMVWATFGRGSAPLQKVAVQVLGQIDDPGASRSLVMLAVFSGSAEVRRTATETLRRRDAREFAGLLIAMIQQPIKYQVKPVGGPGQPGELLIKGQGSTPNLRRVYAPPPAPSVIPQPGDRVVFDNSGLPMLFRPESFSQTSNFSAAQWGSLGLNEPMPTSQQKNQLMGLLSHSGLGSHNQRIGQVLIGAWENQVNTDNNPYFSPRSLLPLALANLPDNGLPVLRSTVWSMTLASGDAIPIGRMAIEAQKTAAGAQQQLQSDVNSINDFNASLDQFNDRVVPVLKDISGVDIGPDPSAWEKWLNNLVGFNTLLASEPPTVTENVPLNVQPDPIPLVPLTIASPGLRVSCFGAGTKVRSLSGIEPIESLKVGDQVLTQSVKTGALAYKPILAVHHNPPSKTYEIKLGDETIVSSHFHRFWKAGSGWVMARDLKIGDPIRTLSGTVSVAAIEDGRVVPVFNLDVADDADFFVGDAGALAHDNTLPKLRETPFDAVVTQAHIANPSHD